MKRSITKIAAVKVAAFAAAALFLACAAWSCREDEPEMSVKPDIASLVFSADGLTAASGGQAVVPEFTVTTNQGEWSVELSEKDSWLRADVNGSTFTLSASANEGFDEREAITVTVRSGKARQVSISVTQESLTAELSVHPAVAAMVFSFDGKTVTSGGQTMIPEFTVTTNQGEWSVELSEKDSWLKITESANGFTLSADENTGVAERAPITVKVRAGNAAEVAMAVTQEGASLGHSVYICGMTYDDWLPGLWHDGELEILGDDDTYLSGIAFSDRGVYLSATRESEYNYEYSTEALCWHDGKFTALSGEGTLSIAVGIAVSGPDVYIAGAELIEDDVDEYTVPVYWKNGVSHSLPAPGNKESECYAMDIFISGSDIYVLGVSHDYDDERYSIVYWRNGELINPGINYGDMRNVKMAVDGSDVYILAVYQDDAENIICGYWKNGQFNQMDSTGEIYLFSIEAFAGDIYIGGVDINQNAVYWKNGVKNKLGIGAVYDITFYEGVMYALGVSYSDSGESVCYWIDGETRVDVPEIDGDYWEAAIGGVTPKIAVGSK